MDPGLAKDLGRYAYLMQFADGNRIDLTFRELNHLQTDLKTDSLTRVLLDKDNLCDNLPQSSDESYLPALPTEEQFKDCCNEFWWLMPYVVKGLWRGELIGPQHYLEIIRGQLIEMLQWYYGVQTDFKRAPGKSGRFFPKVLGEDLWEKVEDCYPGHEQAGVWESLFTMGDVFRTTAKAVAESSGFSYPEQDDARVSAFIRMVKTLPLDAEDFGI
jgi:aminoglycoside 6-adenylyltransferase